MYKHFFKRAIDIIISGVALLILSPILLIVALLLLLFNEGAGVFFTQTRPGKNEKPFRIIKFRTMNNRKDGNGKLLPDKQRITRFGNFVRKTSLDELPQLWNVLIGDMSLIGPRPLLMEYLPLYSARQHRRHDIRPGITGWAQCHGRNNLSWGEKFELDVWYVDNVSFIVDCRVITMTIKGVLKRDSINNDNSTKYTAEPFNGNN